MSTPHLRKLLRYRAWADELIYDAVAALPEGASTAPRATIFGNMLRTLSHSWVVDDIFQAHLQGRVHGYTSRNTPEPLPFDELRSRQQAMNGWYLEYASALTPAQAAEVVTFQFIGGGEGRMSREEMVLHVVNHATYHRGFVADMFYQVPVKPPATDLPVFLRDAPQE
ncbi:DinB family protein [Dyella japonica]|uniref:Damage-inducible protein DinB n=1 Tax=Dyella japonica DSM 16301 TaxID=1440762 RepID=A0A0G9H9I7_9GAMM|nr:DinB family protein [Dyella japonica]KLD65914.1 damage-inducible protein DinB [Dyella japonica DSM 16301]